MKEDISGVTLEHFLLEEAEKLVVEREQPAREQPGDDDDVIVIVIFERLRACQQPGQKSS